jgi:tetratricopeptide (TPR) repeat protein
MLIEPRTIGLGEAIDELRRTVNQLGPDEPCPYFVIAGGGISTPAMPLSAEIILHCKQLAPKRANDQVSQSPAVEYSQWLKRAYPQPKHRQQYFANLVKNATVNAANLFLAHILLESRLAQIVVTPNFDDLLMRALRLFGASPQVFDHPATVARVAPRSGETQIIHVHGSYHSYHLANLELEIAIGTPAGPSVPMNMSDQLLSLMRDCSPIVIGYAGWEKDAIMHALSRRLTDRLPFNLYWFLYSRDELTLLPPWLRDHVDVYFVIAGVPTAEGALQSVSTVSAGGGADGGLTPEPGIETLDAALALHELIVALELPVPTLLRAPVQFFLDQVSSAVSKEVERFEKYSFAELVQTLKRLAQHAASAPAAEGPGPYVALVAASRAGKVDHVVQEAAKLDHHELSDERLGVVTTAVKTAADSLQIDRENKKNGLRLFLRLSRERYLRDVKPSTVKEFLATALDVGQSLEDIGAFDEAVAEYSQLIDGFTGDQTHHVKARVIDAKRRMALLMARNLGQSNAAIDLIESVLDEPVTGKEMRIAISGMRLAFAEVLTRTGRDPLPVLDAIIRDYRDAKMKLERTAAEAWIRKGVYLWKCDRADDAFAAYNEVFHYTASRPFLARYAARAYRDVAFMYEKIGDPKAIDVAAEGLAYLHARSAELRPSQEAQFRISLMFLKAKSLAVRVDVDDSRADTNEVVDLFRRVVDEAAALGAYGEEYVSSLDHLARHATAKHDHESARKYEALAAAVRNRR